MWAFVNPGNFKDTKNPIKIFEYFQKWEKGSFKQMQ